MNYSYYNGYYKALKKSINQGFWQCSCIGKPLLPLVEVVETVSDAKKTVVISMLDQRRPARARVRRVVSGAAPPGNLRGGCGQLDAEATLISWAIPQTQYPPEN